MAISAERDTPDPTDTMSDNLIFQHLIWGYSILGDVTEQDATLAEGTPPNDFWDRTRADLRSVHRSHHDQPVPVPDWWALPHLPVRWREDALHQELTRTKPA